MLVNTSFNVRGEPIVRTPEDALCCFLNTDMDYVFIEGCLFSKSSEIQYENLQPSAEWVRIRSIPENLRVAIWPFGSFGRALLDREILRPQQISCFIDSHRPKGESCRGKPILSPAEANADSFDAIVIASGGFLRQIFLHARADPRFREKTLFRFTEQSGPMRFREPERFEIPKDLIFD
jgi:hypothetical protein